MGLYLDIANQAVETASEKETLHEGQASSSESYADREWDRFLSVCRPSPSGQGWYDYAVIEYNMGNYYSAKVGFQNASAKFTDAKTDFDYAYQYYVDAKLDYDSAYNDYTLGAGFDPGS